MPRYLARLLALLLAVCAVSPAVAAQQKGPLVLAAASLQEAMVAAADAWKAKGHARPTLSFAGTSALARQIEAGAPADLFVAADEQWMDYVAAKGLVRPRTRSAFLTNSLVLIAPASSRTHLRIAPRFALAAALGNGRLAMADPDAVPAGRYGKQALVSLAVWNSVAGRIAQAENVRVALALVGRNEAPLGIVYATDARADSSVRVVGTFPKSSHAPISYPLAVLTKATNADTLAFRRFLLSAEGKAVFRRFGFGTR